MSVSLSPNSLDETTSHSTKLPKTAAKSLVIPQAGERERSRYASFTFTMAMQRIALPNTFSFYPELFSIYLQ